MSKARWMVLVVAGLAALVALWPREAAVRGAAPEISVQEWLTPNPPDVAQLTGRPYVVEFWATWCGPCRETVPHLIALNRKYQDSGLVFMGLAVNDDANKVRTFIAEQGMNYHVGLDSGTAARYGVNGIPHAAVVNRKGVVMWAGHPADPAFEAALAGVTATAPAS